MLSARNGCRGGGEGGSRDGLLPLGLGVVQQGTVVGGRYSGGGGHSRTQ